jgi:hypothetical protein
MPKAAPNVTIPGMSICDAATVVTVVTVYPRKPHIPAAGAVAVIVVVATATAAASTRALIETAVVVPDNTSKILDTCKVQHFPVLHQVAMLSQFTSTSE